jgi:PAS domain S-box-containing protein
MMPKGPGGDEPWSIPPRQGPLTAGRTARHLSQIWDLPIAMIGVGDFEGYFVAVNPVYLAILGWSEEELLAKPCWEIVHPDDRDDFVEATATLLDGASVSGYELRVECQDGRYLRSLWNAAANTDEQLIYAVGLPLR